MSQSLYAVYRHTVRWRSKMDAYCKRLQESGAVPFMEFHDTERLHISIASWTVDDTEVGNAISGVAAVAACSKPIVLQLKEIAFPRRPRGEVARRNDRLWAIFEPVAALYDLRNRLDRVVYGMASQKKRVPHTILAFGVRGAPISIPFPVLPVSGLEHRAVTIDHFDLEIRQHNDGREPEIIECPFR